MLNGTTLQDSQGNRNDAGTGPAYDIPGKYGNSETQTTNRAYAGGWMTNASVTRLSLQPYSPTPLTSAVMSIEYDAWGRLANYEPARGVSTLSGTLSYDALGRLIIHKAHNSVGNTTETHFYAYAGEQMVLDQRDEGSGWKAAHYIWSPDGRLVARERGAGWVNTGDAAATDYVLTDLNGRTSAVTNSAGTVLERYGYDIDGRVKALDTNFAASAASAGPVSTIRWF